MPVRAIVISTILDGSFLKITNKDDECLSKRNY